MAANDILAAQAKRKRWEDFYEAGTPIRSTGWGYWEGVEVMMGTHHLNQFEMSSNMHTVFTKLGNPTRYMFKDGPVRLNPLLVEGSVSIIGANTRWLVESDGSPQTNIGIKIDPEFLAKCAASSGIVFDAREVESRFGLTDRRLTELLKLLAEDYDAGSPFGRGFGESLSQILALHLATKYGNLALHRAEKIVGMGQNTVVKVKDYIRGNLHTSLSLAEIAEAVGYSPYHLHRAFRQETGLRLHEYIQSVRVEAAQFLLRTSDWSISRVAAEVGFSDASHLSRQIRRVVGSTPSEYRRSARSSNS